MTDTIHSLPTVEFQFISGTRIVPSVGSSHRGRDTPIGGQDARGSPEEGRKNRRARLHNCLREDRFSPCGRPQWFVFSTCEVIVSPLDRHAGCARRRVRRIRQHLLRRAHREGSPQAARAQVPRLFQAAGCRGIHAPAFVERSTVRRGGLGTAVNSCTSGANSGQCLDRSRTRCSTCGRCRTAR